MAWYRAGSVTVTNGSAVITGAGTDFVSNTSVGEAFLGPDGRNYEIAQVVSATQIALGSAYQGASASAQGFAILPTQSFARDLALGAAQLLNTFAAVRDGVGNGLFPDGTVATPSVRFAADQDTGVYRAASDRLGLVAGGVLSAVFGPAGISLNVGTNFGADAGFPAAKGVGTSMADRYVLETVSLPNYGMAFGVPLGTMSNATVIAGFFGTVFVAGGVEIARFDRNGSFMTGVKSAPCHTLARGGGKNDQILNVSGIAFPCAQFYSAAGAAGSSAAAAVRLGASDATGRSINAGGTINASGADYAEYMTKAEGCGPIAKGDVCGVDRDGLLTRTWSDAISFVVKSTDPSLVGGDVWTSHMDPRPEAPVEPVAPGAAPAMSAGNDSEMLDQWRAAVAVHETLVAAYRKSLATWIADQAAFDAAVKVWEADLETARLCVDRIAFCGQVPVNVTGDFAVGDYVIAVANGSGIKAIAIAESAITFDQYRRRIGKVWAVREGRAWVDVQHG